MRPWFACLLALLLASCSAIPTPSGKYAVMLGGKGHLEYGPGGTMAYTYSNEKSFQHATQAIVAVAASAASASVSKAKEVTTQVKDTNATKATINASNNATAVETAKINAQGAAISANPDAVAKGATTLNAP